MVTSIPTVPACLEMAIIPPFHCYPGGAGAAEVKIIHSHWAPRRTSALGQPWSQQEGFPPAQVPAYELEATEIARDWCEEANH